MAILQLLRLQFPITLASDWPSGTTVLPIADVLLRFRASKGAPMRNLWAEWSGGAALIRMRLCRHERQNKKRPGLRSTHTSNACASGGRHHPSARLPDRLAMRATRVTGQIERLHQE